VNDSVSAEKKSHMESLSAYVLLAVLRAVAVCSCCMLHLPGCSLLVCSLVSRLADCALCSLISGSALAVPCSLGVRVAGITLDEECKNASATARASAVIVAMPGMEDATPSARECLRRDVSLVPCVAGPPSCCL
jgi:hypothetical protein